MKKLLFITVFLLFAMLTFSLTLGIQGQFISTGFKVFDKGIRITTVYDNTIADSFLHPGDILLGFASGQVLGACLDESTGKMIVNSGPGLSAGYTVKSKYINDLQKNTYPNISTLNQFKEQLSMIDANKGSLVLNFVIYRNQRFIYYEIETAH